MRTSLEANRNGFSGIGSVPIRTQVVAAHWFYPKSEMVSHGGGGVSGEIISASLRNEFTDGLAVLNDVHGPAILIG